MRLQKVASMIVISAALAAVAQAQDEHNRGNDHARQETHSAPSKGQSRSQSSGWRTSESRPSAPARSQGTWRSQGTSRSQSSSYRPGSSPREGSAFSHGETGRRAPEASYHAPFTPRGSSAPTYRNSESRFGQEVRHDPITPRGPSAPLYRTRETGYGGDRGHSSYAPHSPEFRQGGGDHGRALVHVNNWGMHGGGRGPGWNGNWREGYGASARFSVNSFHFGFYVGSPYEESCYVSPWYYYSALPAYVPASRVVVLSDYHCPWNEGVVYDYQPAATYTSYGVASLNRSLDDLTAVFGSQNAGAISELMPGGEVAVWTDGAYDYSLSGGDFYNMVQDQVSATHAENFHIDNVTRIGNQAIVDCTDEVAGSGGFETVYQQFRLQLQAGRYVITDFMTSQTPTTE